MKLPLNCSVDYISNFLSHTEANDLYQLLINEYHINTSRLVIEAGGKMVKTDSFKILFLTDELKNSDSYPEYVHGKSFVWKGLMASLGKKVQKHTGKDFEVAMCLYYPNGQFFSEYHFDQQTSGFKTILPSLSLGEVREFCLKENETGEVYSIDLANGSLLVMGDYCQSRYTHSLIKNEKYKNDRINITFRESTFK